MTAKGAAQPDRPDETAPPSDGGAASTGPADGGHGKAGKAAKGAPKSGADQASDAVDGGAVDEAKAGDGGAGGAAVSDDAKAEAGAVAADGEGTKPDEPKSKTDAEPKEPEPAEDTAVTSADQAGDELDGQSLYTELETLRRDLGELTRDLQRMTAEYANYRKRVERDRTLAGEQATAGVVTQLLPVLDDLDRARDHGDLVGPFGAVADQLVATLTKFGVTPFGEPGDAFDPTVHEAVSHTSSPDVSETTCVEVMRRGYLLGDRLLRAALVGVADPE